MVTDKKTSRNTIFQRILFTALVCVGLIIQIFFFANIVMWRSAPDKGWYAMNELGPNIIASTRHSGEQAGLERGDKILSINGNPVKSFEDLNTLIDYKIGHINEYKLEREGKILIVSVTTSELGLRNVIMQSGVIWVLGMIILTMGIFVFLMKPFHGPSWAFLTMTMIMGIFITYSASSYFYKPQFLENVDIFVLSLFPASIIHLAVLFPEKRAWFVDKKLWIAPYVASLTLGGISRSFSLNIFNIPAFLLMTIYVYLFGSILLFLGSLIFSYIRSKSQAVKLQSLVIFSGITVALLIPILELLSNIIFRVSFFKNPVYFYLFFLLFFPLSIGYAIVKHDLFAIDVLVRRTYGYITSTAAIIGIYALIVSLLNVTFQSSEISKSPIFSIIFALSVVFFFRPLHERFQGFIDRLFYRQRYNYRKTIRDISEAMTSILDPQQIHKTLIGSVVKEMFLENGLLLLPNPSENIYHAKAIESDDKEKLSSMQINEDNELIKVLYKKNDAVFRTEVDLNPRYDNNREALQQTFQSFDSELMLPMKYKDEMRGIISLGGKKSGKMFTPEDIDLIKTLTSQSVIALENAKLFQENLEKSRMEEELKIAHDIQISMLPEKAPMIEGFTIAATSIPAKEVGGDFYDFHNISSGETIEKLGIVVGDVSGKAVSGALVMAASRSIFRVLSETHSSVDEIMKRGNARLKSDVKKGMFVALLYAVLDSHKKTLTISNAGQTQPIICSGDKKPSFIDTDGDRFPLGIVKDCDYQETTLTLNQGDTVVLYTDGVVEAMNDKNELYGFDRFLTSIEKSRHLNANDVLRKLVDDASSYVGDMEQHDDLTIVVLTVG